MRDHVPDDRHGLPDPGGLNIDYQDAGQFEPTTEQLDRLRSELDVIADGVRGHLTDEFTITTQIKRSEDGIQAHVIIEFPTGEAMVPAIPITAEMFEGADEPNWNGPISQEDIETLRRDITTAAVTRWAERLDRIGGPRARPAS